jgi:integrase
VAEKLAKALREVQQGLPVGTDRQTVGQFLEYWLEHVARQRVRASTFRSYEDRIRNHVLPFLGTVRLSRLTPQRVQAFLSDRLAAGASPQSCRYSRAVLRTALTHAMRWGLLPQNPAVLVDVPRTTKAEIRPFSPEQARAFLAATAGHRLEALFSVALALGLRQGEALGLTWEDVDLEAGVLHVRHTLQRVGGDRKKLATLRREWKALLERSKEEGESDRSALAKERKRLWGEICEVRRTFALTEPKSTRSRRTVNLPVLVVTALRAHRVRQLQERLVAGGDWKEMGLVFTTRVGTPIDPRAVTTAFHAILADAGLPSIRYHDLRHTAATLLLAQGVNARVVMETLGHSQISLTLDTYSHVLPALQKHAADQMHAVLTGSKG